MSDEIRAEDEVEAHGPLPEGPLPEVEAHGPLPEGPLPEGPLPEVEAHGPLPEILVENAKNAK